MRNLKEKTQIGIILSFLTNLITQVFQFVSGLVLTRLLTPADYGLVAMLYFFISLVDVFINSGFGVAIIRKKTPTSVDYSTVFWLNLLFATLAYLILFLSSTHISRFYNDERLININKILGLVLLINGFGSIQGKYLNKEMMYKSLSKVYIITIFVSNVLGILFAIWGYGPWSIVIRTLSWSLILNLGWWLVSPWKPKYEFSINSLRELSNFGLKNFFITIINTFSSNFYSVLIGKLYNAESLGYFSRAKQFYDLPEYNIRSSSMFIFFTSFSQIQDDDMLLTKAYSKMLAIFAYLLYPIYLIMAIISPSMIIVLLTPKWIESAHILQYLCILALLLPFEAVNENILYVKGKLEYSFFILVIKKIFFFIFILLFYNIGVQIVVFGLIIEGFLGVIISIYFSNKLLKFSLWEQIRSIIPTLFMSLILLVIALFVSTLLNSDLLKVIIIPFLALIAYVFMSILLNRFELRELIELMRVLIKQKPYYV